MLKQEPHPGGDRGWIVNVASIAGLVGVGTGKSFSQTNRHTPAEHLAGAPFFFFNLCVKYEGQC